MGRRPEGERGHRQARAWALGAVALLLLVAVPAPASVLPDLSSNACENPLPRSVAVCEEWVTFSATNSVGDADPLASVMSSDGSTVYIAGFASFPGTGRDVVVVSLSVETGAVEWEYIFDGEGHGRDIGYGIALDPQRGHLYVTGESEKSDGTRDLLVISLTGDGVERWSTTWSSGNDQNSFGRSLAFDTVTGMLVVQGEVPASGMATLQGIDGVYGSIEWTILLSDDERHDAIQTVDLPGPWVAALFRKLDVEDSFDYYVSVYHAGSGVLKWSDQWDVGNHSWDEPLALISNGQALLATGYAVSFGEGTKFATIAWNASTGRELWNRTYDSGPGNDQARAVAISPDGDRVFVAGNSEFTLSVVAYALQNGSELWTSSYEDPWKGIRSRVSGFASSDRSGAAGAIVADAGSDLFISGYSESWRSPLQSDRDILIVRFDAENGRQERSYRFNGPGWDWDQGTFPSLLVYSQHQETTVVTGRTEDGVEEDRFEWVSLGIADTDRTDHSEIR